MKIFDWLNSTVSSIRNGIENARQHASAFHNDNQNRTNPASSLPMNGSVDIHGNTFGTGGSISHDPFAEQHHHHHHDHYNSHHNAAHDYHHHHYDHFNNHSSSHHDYHDPFRNY